MAANNTQQEERTIDVHRLKTREAVRKTEIAIRDALVAGDTRLRVICGRGSRSERGLPVLKLALIAAMEQCVVFSHLLLFRLTIFCREKKTQDRDRSGSSERRAPPYQAASLVTPTTHYLVPSRYCFSVFLFVMPIEPRARFFFVFDAPPPFSRTTSRMYYTRL
jgi:hypothetical protein